MNAYIPREAMKRIRQAGIARQHAEAIAAGIVAVATIRLGLLISLQ